MSSFTLPPPPSDRPRPRLTVDSTTANANANASSPRSLIPQPSISTSSRNVNGKRSAPTTPTDRAFSLAGMAGGKEGSPGSTRGGGGSRPAGMMKRGSSQGGSPGSGSSTPRRILTKYENHQLQLSAQKSSQSQTHPGSISGSRSLSPSPSPLSAHFLASHQPTNTPYSPNQPQTQNNASTSTLSPTPLHAQMLRANSLPSPSHPLQEDEPEDFSPRNTDFYRRISEVIADPKGLFHRREWSEEGFVGVKDPYAAAMELGRENERSRRAQMEEEERQRQAEGEGEAGEGVRGSGRSRRPEERELRLEDLDFEFRGLGLEGGGKKRLERAESGGVMEG
ncbi:hypothetical protein BDY24DRAFT_389507 [Mrakia frigida]|uniref:uncharacterized protein n=1 Tax=Mrakia frigida TaxID=29902 RepID=UPI003FCBEF66